MATKVATKTPDVESKSVTWQFADGTTRQVFLSELSDDIITNLALHGLSQKGGDSYSGAESTSEAIERFNSVIDSLIAGDWNIGRAATGGIWVDALAQAAGVERSEALVKWNSADDETRKQLKAHPAIKAAKAEIELERAKAKAKAAGEGGSIDLDDI